MIQTQENSPSPAAAISRLRKLAAPRLVEELCELCGATISSEHAHLLELKSRQLMCACEACAILFSGVASMRYRRVSRRIVPLTDLQITDEFWDSLHIPINLAFFYCNSQTRQTVVMYPSPAGATESLLPVSACENLSVLHPALKTLEDDVEAMLVNRIGTSNDAFIVPIDQCYRLVGIIRTHWRGLSGGTDVWREITIFFDQLHRVGTSAQGARHA